MTLGTVKSADPLTAKAIGRQYYRDAVQMLMRPGSFFEALPTAKHRQDALVFMGVTAVIYSLPATVFTPVQRPTFMVLYLMNALLMPVVTALVLHLLLRLIYPGRYAYNLLLGVAAYANVVLLLSWIPGLTPWAEILKYVLIGLGLVKTGGISGWKASGVIFATACILVQAVYFLQFLMRF